MIAFGDAAASTLQNILIVKRVMDFCFLAPLVFWSGLFMMYRVDILFKLRSPTSYVYTDFRWAALTRFTGLVLTSAALAVCITLGRLYH